MLQKKKKKETVEQTQTNLPDAGQSVLQLLLYVTAVYHQLIGHSCSGVLCR